MPPEPPADPSQTASTPSLGDTHLEHGTRYPPLPDSSPFRAHMHGMAYPPDVSPGYSHQLSAFGPHHDSRGYSLPYFPASHGHPQQGMYPGMHPLAVSGPQVGLDYRAFPSSVGTVLPTPGEAGAMAVHAPTVLPHMSAPMNPSAPPAQLTTVHVGQATASITCHGDWSRDV
ncbi:hypothetical protein BDW22DRAFT_1433390 [Trametopsis cervina]|nr:hypothetical protein BDW22DRAFT_1433390 [Trametopsis cervina]